MSNILEKQIDQFIDTLESYNRKLPHPRARENYGFLRHFFKKTIKELNDRADEVGSPECAKVRDLALAQFPVRTFWNYCIDGRVLSILAHGAPASVGRSIRVPGGILREFVRGENGKLHILEDSVFATYIKKAFETFQVDTIAEVFDSHVGCAARYVEEKEKGREPKDFGLMADISHKKQMTQATEEFAAALGKRILAIQTSFDPHTGFLYMGLETKNALTYARKHGNIYTDKILTTLVEKNTILSTEQLAGEEPITQHLHDHYFPLQWDTEYIKTAKLFWTAIADMRPVIIPILKKRLKMIYADITQEELEERAILLMTNMFSGYLNNQNVKPTAKNIKKEIKENMRSYRYGTHKEEALRISEGAYPPYKTSMFAIFSSEDENLPSHVKLTASLVRKNRLDERVIDPTKSFVTPQTFAEAAVPVIVQEIEREPISDEEWKLFAQIDWSDMPTNWEQIWDDDFYSYLKTKGITHFGVAISINNLRKRMAVLYYPYNSISSRLIENYLVALPLIVGRYRKNQFIVPFAKLGIEY